MRKIHIENKKRFAIFIAVIVIAIVGVVFGVYKIVKWRGAVPEIEKMSIKDASKIGEKKNVQLLIQIAPTNPNGGFERGDVVLTADENKEFSTAEQEGFLIIKMKLTEDEQQLLALSLNEQKGVFASEEERMNAKTIKQRKFAVDLAKIGIAPSETRGKVIADKVFEDDVLIEKK